MHLNVFDTAAVLTMLAALFGYINHRFLKLPFAIGLTVSALAASGVVFLVDLALPSLGLIDQVRAAVAAIDFTEALMHGMLSFLLFAGALHVNLDELLDKLGPILTLATVGVMISAVLVGFGSYAVFSLVGLAVPLAWCLVFGALIAPTDPVAVLGIMRAAGASRGHEVKIVGESLFNDGVGVVLFSILVHFARETAGGGFGHHALFVLEEVGGGLVIGLGGGYLAYRAMRTLDEANLEILISLALVMGVTMVSFAVHASAPLACVAAGLLIGNQGRRLAMSSRTRDVLDVVWSFFDETLNAVLFLLVGLEVLAIELSGRYALVGAIMIVLVLGARYVSVAIPITAMRRLHNFTPGVIKVLTWGGLRGGISIALALSLPPFEGRDAVLAATYSVVLFSIIVQGLTVGRLIRSLRPA